jgi:hypothetical protein
MHMSSYDACHQQLHSSTRRLHLLPVWTSVLASLGVCYCNTPIKTNIVIKQNLFRRSNKQRFSIMVFNETQTLNVNLITP